MGVGVATDPGMARVVAEGVVEVGVVEVEKVVGLVWEMVELVAEEEEVEVEMDRGLAMVAADFEGLIETGLLRLHDRWTTEATMF
ncbi:hypothetical protein QJS04_geneDACA000265 [Acorus gramineus]|uniref:Uncharacterized protein n=1 Tax=Acorus gramineus TaxID=55184 RepID=A0AAV9ANX6_ACOGR|nr:hypothetical protein QJS04_geneDACA000265 [Acorus gramineus]